MENCFFDDVDHKYSQLKLDFKCKSNFFENYIKYNAYIDKRKGLGTTHLFVQGTEDHPDKILGFYTLKNTALIIDTDDPRYKLGFAALEISQFATHKDNEKQDIGRIMIQNIVNSATEMNENYSAIRYIVLCSVTDAIGFYTKMNFNILDDGMMIPREDWNVRCHPMYLNISSV